MMEQNLAILFKDFAKEIKHHREELAASVPEADGLCGGLDELIRFLEEQSQTLLSAGGSETENT